MLSKAKRTDRCKCPSLEQVERRAFSIQFYREGHGKLANTAHTTQSAAEEHARLARSARERPLSFTFVTLQLELNPIASKQSSNLNVIES